jgi:hypothetical protein
MANRVKVQKVDREKTRSFYVNLPIVLAEAMDIQKGEEFDWLMEDKNTLIFTRAKPTSPRKTKSTRP